TCLQLRSFPTRRSSDLGRTHGGAKSVLGTRSGRQDVAHTKSAASDGPHYTMESTLVRRRAFSRWNRVPMVASECSCGLACHAYRSEEHTSELQSRFDLV